MEGYVLVNNGRLTEKEAKAIYGRIHHECP